MLGKLGKTTEYRREDLEAMGAVIYIFQRLTLGLHRRVKAKTFLQADDVPIDDEMTKKSLFTPQEKGRIGQKAIKWMAKLFTNILSTGSIPSVWKQAKVLAILKPGKTSDDPNNYRPISLLCIPYKILERIILNRISPIIEEHLPIEQAGFRPGRNCAEQTLALTTTIEDGFQKKLKTGAVFVDLTAAYDTVWREGLLYKLSKIINCKNIIKLINNFLTNRKITVHLNNKKSRPRTLNNGLPQGSVLAPLLFNVYTADIPATNSQKFLYADDIALLHQEQSFSTLEQILNEDLKKLENFFSKWHLIPNPSKTVSSVFHLNNHKANRPLKLTFCNKPLSHDPCPKYLGVTLDRSLTFRQHLEKTRDKLKTRNNIMTRLAGTTWGCSADTLRTTALALVYSVAEYCAPVWERSSHTDSIDAQLNQTMRLITGNMRPTPIDWLPYLSNIAPPDLRRKKSTSNLLSKIKANTKLPINTVLEIPPPTRLISRNPAWVADENVDLKEEWRNRWSNLAIANKDLVEDPNTKPPGYNLPRRTWSTLNRIRTSTGRCNYLLNKWNMSPDQNCDCGQIQTMHHILRDCPRRFFQGTLGDIHRCTEEALDRRDIADSVEGRDPGEEIEGKETTGKTQTIYLKQWTGRHTYEEMKRMAEENKTADFVNLRSLRLRGLPPEGHNKEPTMLKSEPGETSAQVPSTYISLQQPRYPSTFVGDGSEDAQRWLKDYQRVAKFNRWDDSMCLANVIFFLAGTARQWYENNEDLLTSWEVFQKALGETFGEQEEEMKKAEIILKTRAQKSSESSESYIQDVLYLCQLANPLMDDETKLGHLMKGIAEDIYQILIAKDVEKVDQKFERLPNVALVAYEEEDLPSMIRRIVQEEFQKVKIPSTACFLGVEQKAESAPLEDLIKREIKRELAPITGKSSFSRPQRSYTRPLPPQRSPENSEVRKTDAWRTPNDQPICFHCGRPGHVVRYCRDRRRIFEEARGRRTNYFPNAEFSRYEGELESELNKRYRNPSPYPGRGRSPILKHWLIPEPIFSVISENFRRHLRIPFFVKKGPILRVANKKYVETLGRCNIRITIKELEVRFNFVVLSECSHHIILGWDFFQATNAIIDWGTGEMHLEECASQGIEDEDLAVYACEDCIIPGRSISKIAVISEKVQGAKDLIVEGHKDLLLKKELAIPSSVINFHHGRGDVWVTNATSRNQIIPAGMLVGNLGKIGSSGIFSIDMDDCKEIRTNIKNEDIRQNILSLVDDTLSKEQKSNMAECLINYAEIFDFERRASRPFSGVKHKIDTSDNRPIKQRPYRVSPTERRAIQGEVDKMIKMGVAQPSESPWSSPVVLVKKKDGSWRFCVDYRRLNRITKKDVYPIPRTDDVLDSLTGAKFYSSMDLRTGYWQIEIDEGDREKTAFVTPDGLYEFRVMPFGLCNAPATFERMMDNLLAGLKWTICLCYLDDIIVYASSFQEHMERLEKTLKCIQRAGLCLNPEKCRFGSKIIKVLGHLVSEEGIRPDPGKIEAIINFPTPKNTTDVRSFIGLCSYYRRFVRNFANKAKPLHELLKNNTRFVWSKEQDESFQILKAALTTDPLLGHYKEEAETHLHTDAREEKPIAYASRTLNAAEKNYSTTERECLAVVWAIYKFRPYLFGRHFTVVSDHHSLCWLANIKDPSGRLARWALRLQEFDISIVYKSGKKHQDADCLSRNPLLDTDENNIPELISITDVRKEQEKDDQITKIIQGSQSKGDGVFKLIEGILYRKNYDPMGKMWLLVVPKQMRIDILREAHDSPMAGHLGFAKTYDRVRKKYFWPGMYRSVKQYVSHCRECQRRKGSTGRPPGQLVPIPPVARPFSEDYLSRYAITRAIPNGSAEEVAKFMVEDILLKHGAPRELISDRGRTFISRTLKEINDLCGTIHRFTSAYHPQTNGLTERLNKTLADMLSMYVDVEQRNWDAVLPYVTFAYNTSQQESTAYRENTSLEDYVESMVTNAEDARQLARLNILRSQERDKSRYDQSHRPVHYQTGDLVWVFTPVRRQGLAEKLLKRYFGPYRVNRQLSEVTYEVEPLEKRPRQRKTKDIVHVQRMKPYRSPEEQIQA
ncbi:hypothetical protein LAZ67_11001769 [Cordylochernes scorpioides]|uniref:RNA-directed DNA polymerase n=1 Tax=Cordylochernes scorpioides TaxID=51811 RepID=A0ABY6L1E7_9ARAC|nr:hypothetical protein LAZ67_11001769 [Cordylochernes scorpioides]